MTRPWPTRRTLRSRRPLAAIAGWATVASWLGACVHDEATLAPTPVDCPAGLTDCGGACVNTDLDPYHCGDCGTACSSDELCSVGTCSTECLGGTTKCGGTCVDANLDPHNCGGCGTECSTNELCSNGSCNTDCLGGTTECGGACVDTQIDPQNCGACGQACGPGEICLGSACMAPSCAAILAKTPGASDGLYTIDPDGNGGEAPFEVACDMTTEGGGWITLALDEPDGVLMAENAANNPWLKCADDSAQHFAGLTEDQVTADYTGTLDQAVTLSYKNPLTNASYTTAQMDVLRALISELGATTRMVAVTSDDDNGNWQNTQTSGHEVYVKGSAQSWTLLTPGEDGDCGGGAGSYPTPGSKSGYYLWHHTAAGSEVDGQTGLTSNDLQGLAKGDLLPYEVRLVVQTGGGVAFGFEQPTLRVR